MPEIAKQKQASNQRGLAREYPSAFPTSSKVVSWRKGIMQASIYLLKRPKEEAISRSD
ncbi:MAG: hypothetical protein HN759_11870 [Akkermansiaceae bacterium]|nr:hypothetical protein [Akkermansiaceae bacterium]